MALDTVSSDESFELGAVCPDLVRWLDQQGYRDRIHPGLDSIDSRGEARELIALLPSATASRSTRRVDRSSLERIVTTIRRADDAQEGEQANWFEQWIAKHLDEMDWGPPDWLDDWGDGLAWGITWFLRLLYVVLAVSVLALGVWLMIKAHERLRPLWFNRPASGAPEAMDANVDPSQLSRAEQPGALLQRVITYWRRSGWLPASPGRSNTELAAELAQAPPMTRQRFRRLATLAEIGTYAGRVPTEAELQRCFEDAAALVGEEGKRA